MSRSCGNGTKYVDTYFDYKQLNQMKTLKRFLAVLLLAVVPVLASAQDTSRFSERVEITEMSTESNTQYQVFKMRDEGQFYLSVGHIGFGSDIVQLQVDPVFELFIPLGDSLSGALEMLQELQAFYKQPRLSTMEVEGCLAAFIPTEDRETVTVTARQRLLTKVLEFSVKRDDLVRATYIDRSDFNALVFGVKAYMKLHPKEQ